MTREQIIQAVQAYSVKTGLAPSTITGRAVNNSRLYRRLIDGGDCTTEIAGKLIGFIEADEGSRSTNNQIEGAA